VVIKCTQLYYVYITAPQFWEWEYKTMLRAEPAEFFLVSILYFDILGYVSRKWCKNSPFYLLLIFSGGTGTTIILRAMMGLPLDTPLCGAEERSESGTSPKIEWAGAGCEKNTVERSGERGLQKEAWAVSGNFDRSRSAHMLCHSTAANVIHYSKAYPSKTCHIKQSSATPSFTSYLMPKTLQSLSVGTRKLAIANRTCVSGKN